MEKLDLQSCLPWNILLARSRNLQDSSVAAQMLCSVTLWSSCSFRSHVFLRVTFIMKVTPLNEIEKLDFSLVLSVCVVADHLDNIIDQRRNWQKGRIEKNWHIYRPVCYFSTMDSAMDLSIHSQASDVLGLWSGLNILSQYSDQIRLMEISVGLWEYGSVGPFGNAN